MCGWCARPYEPTRSHALYCGKSCRQAAHRFGAGVVARTRATGGAPRRDGSYATGRGRPRDDSDEMRPPAPRDGSRWDALVHGVSVRPRRVVGAKPAAFAWWLFELLGALPGDDFPGSGGIARAWALYEASSLEPRRIAAGSR